MFPVCLFFQLHIISYFYGKTNTTWKDVFHTIVITTQNNISISHCKKEDIKIIHNVGKKINSMANIKEEEIK